MKQVLETTVVETPYESHEAFLSRRGMVMAGMIGSLSARLDILKDEMRICYTYEHADLEFLKRQMQSMQKDIVVSLLKYNNEWANMQQYELGDVAKSYSDKAIADLTTELEALKTLAL